MLKWICQIFYKCRIFSCENYYCIVGGNKINERAKRKGYLHLESNKAIF